MYINPILKGGIYSAPHISNKTIFMGAQTLSAPDIFIKEPVRKEKSAPTYKEKIAMLKPYTKDVFSLLKLSMLEDSDFDFLYSKLRETKQRGNLPDNSKTEILYSKDSLFENIVETTVQIPSEDGVYTYYKKAASKKGDNKVLVLRRKELKKDFKEEEFKDKSSFNPKYKVENTYSSIEYFDSVRTNQSRRKITVRKTFGAPIFSYFYSKTTSGQNNDVSITNINDKRYITKVAPNGKVAIKCGNKGSVMDFLSRLDLSDELSNSSNRQELGRINSKKSVFVAALKLLPPQILSEMDDDFDTFKNNGSDNDERTLNVNLFCPSACAKSMIDGTVENVSRKKGLIKDETLVEIFSKERENYLNWLIKDKDNVLKMGEDYYISNINTEEEDLMNTIKAVCRLLWCEDYDENKAGDEDMRLLLNFFPESVSYIASVFEVNEEGEKIEKYA